MKVHVPRRFPHTVFTDGHSNQLCNGRDSQNLQDLCSDQDNSDLENQNSCGVKRKLCCSSRESVKNPRFVKPCRECRDLELASEKNHIRILMEQMAGVEKANQLLLKKNASLITERDRLSKDLEVAKEEIKAFVPIWAESHRNAGRAEAYKQALESQMSIRVSMQDLQPHMDLTHSPLFSGSRTYNSTSLAVPAAVYRDIVPETP